jgi:hypothetical protein
MPDPETLLESAKSPVARGFLSEFDDEKLGISNFDKALIHLFIKFVNALVVGHSGRSRGPRHDLFSSALSNGSWVRIQLEASISVYVYSVFMLFCV